MDSQLITGITGIVGVLVGFLAAGWLQYRRDEVAQAHQMAADKRAYLFGRYETLLLAARKFWTNTKILANSGSLLSPLNMSEQGDFISGSYGTQAFREANEARKEFVRACTLLQLEVDHTDVLEQCDAMYQEYTAYLEQFGKSESPRFGYERFDEAYSQLLELLRGRKLQLENIR